MAGAAEEIFMPVSGGPPPPERNVGGLKNAGTGTTRRAMQLPDGRDSGFREQAPRYSRKTPWIGS